MLPLRTIIKLHMYFKQLLVILTIIFLLPITSIAQEVRETATVEFKVGSAHIDTTYKNNAANLNQIINLIKNIQNDTTLQIINIDFRGSASPEGNSSVNKALSNKRLNSLESYIKSRINYPDSIVTRQDAYIPWHVLATMVENSDIPMRDTVLVILNMEPKEVMNAQGKLIDHRVLKLQKLNNGRIFTEMNQEFFNVLRSARIAITTKQIVDTTPAVIELPIAEPEPVIVIEQPIQPEQPKWTPGLSIKTNAVGWAMAISNLAVEIDFARRWSLNIPVYFSGLNYFKSTTKFRTFAIQPGIRYWFKKASNDGVFLEGHFGMAYYNVAMNSDFRIQDHEGDTPALGGGLSVGYRMPISKNERWKMEFSAGVGAYKAHYDKYHNTANTTEGLYYETVRKTFIGVDHVGISFSYMFNLKKRAKQ